MSIRAHTRSKGHCVAAALAYRIGCEVTDSRTGIRHDFSRRAQRGDVVASGFSYGAQAPAWNRNDVQAFADALEGAERRKNSIVCRDVEIALPHELAPKKREALAARWAQHLASRYNAAVAYAVHRPDRRSDERNHHVHCLMSTRALGKDGTPGAKLRQFHVRAKKPNKEGKPYEPERTDSGGSDEIHTLRAEWEVMCNEALAEAGIDAAIAMGRLEDPRDRAPNLTRGEVEAERNGWRKRHPKTRQLPMRVAQLVVDDGVCVTKRGRELARCVATRAFMEHVTRRPVTRPQALPAAEPEPEQALAAAEAIQPVQSPSPAPEPERPARRRRRRRARHIRAVEASATPAPTPVQASRPVQEPLSPVRPVAAPLTTAPAPISPPARTQGAHSAARTIEAFTALAPTLVTAPERSQEPWSPVRPVPALLTPVPARIPAPARVLKRRIATLRSRLARLAQLAPLRAYVQRFGVIRPVKTPLAPAPEPVRSLARIVEDLRHAITAGLTMRRAEDVMTQVSEIEQAPRRRGPAVAETDPDLPEVDRNRPTDSFSKLGPSREELDTVAGVLQELEQDEQETTAQVQSSTGTAETDPDLPEVDRNRPTDSFSKLGPSREELDIVAGVLQELEQDDQETTTQVQSSTGTAETDPDLPEVDRNRPTDSFSKLGPSREELDIVAGVLQELEQDDQETTTPVQTPTGVETAQERPQATPRRSSPPAAAPPPPTAAPAFLEGEGESRAVARKIRGYEAQFADDRVLYRRTGAPRIVFADVGRRVNIYDWRSEESTLAALQLAEQKWDEFVITGNDEFKAMCVRLAARHGFRITNPELQEQIAGERTRLLAEPEAAERAQAEQLAATHDEQVILDVARASGPDAERRTAQPPTPPHPAEKRPEETIDVTRYGADAIRLVEEFSRLREEHGDLSLGIEFDEAPGSVVGIAFVDARGNRCHVGRESVAAIAAMQALMQKRRPDEIRQFERTLEREIAMELARARERERQR